MAKVLFNFKFQSFSDVITNSSSELFVFKNHNKEAVLLTLDALYPDWRKEYQEPEFVKDMDDKTFDNYLGWVFETYWDDRDEFDSWNHQPDAKEWAKTFKKSCPKAKLAEKLGMKPEKLYTNWKTYNLFSEKWEDRFANLSDEGKKKIKEVFGEDIALWSKEDNPIWEYQEILEGVAKRYHLG